MARLVDYSPSMCAIVTIPFIEVVWGWDWASGTAVLAVIVKKVKTRLITGSGTGIRVAGIPAVSLKLTRSQLLSQTERDISSLAPTFSFPIFLANIHFF